MKPIKILIHNNLLFRKSRFKIIFLHEYDDEDLYEVWFNVDRVVDLNMNLDFNKNEDKQTILRVILA